MTSIISDRPNRPLVVKCGYEGSIRSVSFPSADTCKLDLLRTRLEECFHLSASPFYLVYTDDDGEDFSIRSELDLTEAISYFVSGDDTLSVLSNSSSEKVTLRLDVVVEYDGPSLSDTSSLSSFRTTEQTTESEEDPVYDDLASFSELGNRWLREQSRFTRRNVRIPTEEESSDEEVPGDFALVRNDRGGYYYETSLYEVARAPDSTGPPLLAPDCSACGIRMEYMRYVCLACGEADMHQVDEDDSETVYAGAKTGFELCHGCIENHGIVHARSTRHAFREKIWGPNGWADVEYNEDSACSICATAIHSHRYKCISCSRFDLCRSCYAKVNEIHPAHPFLLLPDRPSRLHAGVFCHNCLQDIVGPRFHCAVCPSWDLCSKCENVPIDEASGHTSDHIMMKWKLSVEEREIGGNENLPLFKMDNVIIVERGSLEPDINAQIVQINTACLPRSEGPGRYGGVPGIGGFICAAVKASFGPKGVSLVLPPYIHSFVMLPVLALVFATLCSAQQVPLAETIVSALSTSPQHTTFLRLLQRSKTIPMLAHMTSATVFAPTDDAWEQWVKGRELDPNVDNQNWELRQLLLYHMLNYTIPSFEDTNVTIHTTLLFPQNEEPIHPPVPPPGPPWLPRGGDGTLGGHGQRLRIGKNIGVEWDGSGGASIWEGWNTTAKYTRNGVVVGINKVLDPPPSVEAVIRSTPSLSYLSKILPKDGPLATAGHLTLFAPNDHAFSKFDAVEKRYLEGDFGSEGVERILGNALITSPQVGWSDAWSKKGNETNTTTGSLMVQRDDKGITVNGTRADMVDIFASNGERIQDIADAGVIHVVPELLVPDSFQLLNSAEKMLLSLNATRFVSLMRSANISQYITSDKPYTMLAPIDDSISFELPELYFVPDMPIKNASPLAALLQYHILPGRLTASHLKDGMLVGTEMQTSALKGGRQQIRVEISDHLSDDISGKVRFQGIPVVQKPVKIGNSVIYLISGLVSPPDDVLQTAVSDLQLSTFIAAVYAADLAQALKRNPAMTYFMPKNKAFSSMGLAMKYLLLPEAKDELRKVVKYHSVPEIIYRKDLEDGKQSFKTSEGEKITIEKGNTTILRNPTTIANISHEALTSTGVIHSIDSVMMPSEVNITLKKLVRGAGQYTMLDLLRRIDVTLPDHYTLLCPTDRAFSAINLTQFDNQTLSDLLRLHIIPSQPAIADNAVYSTLLNTKFGQVAFRATGDNGFLVGIRNARGSINTSARLGQSGYTSVMWNETIPLRGRVIMLDSVLVPYEPSWWSSWGWLVLALSGIGVVLVVAAVSFGWWWMTRDKIEYEPLEGEEED